VRNGFTYYSLARVGSSGAVKITFQLFSTIPNFQAKPRMRIIIFPSSLIYLRLLCLVPVVINGPKSACQFFFSIGTTISSIANVACEFSHLDDCNASSFFHRCDDSYLASTAPNTVTTLETRMSNIAIDLDVSGSGNTSSPLVNLPFDESPAYVPISFLLFIWK
jgi:hypothetical protein